jgi:hypothetical protein
LNQPTFSDPEGLPLTLTIVGIPKNYTTTWLTWNPKNRSISLQPDARAMMPEKRMNLTIVATDDIG